ncbi:uncharacterized protein LOC143280235 [Babylonia areolata]|uniref:uncharacterized protein LOC143280235 n=1 Tax=Babylonia areolata TaxID=304850 RepID=UPI003FD41B21
MAGTGDFAAMATTVSHNASAVNSSDVITPQDLSASSGELAGFVTSGALQAVEKVIHIGVLPVLVITGTVTNVINMAVFRRQGLDDRVNLCLFSLSLADLGYLLFMMAGKCHSLVSLVDPLKGGYWKLRSINTVAGIYWGFMNISATLTVIISLERCACVLAPLHAKLLIRVRTMAVLIVCVFVFGLGLYGLYNLRHSVIARTHLSNSKHSTVYVLGFSLFHLQYRAVTDTVYYFSVAVPIISLLVVATSTAITATQLHLTVAWRKETAQQSVTDSREVALTKMLVAISCVYVVCITPEALMPLMVLSRPEVQPVGRQADLFFAIISVMHALCAINSSVNFIFYWSLGSRYRATLRRLCCCRRSPMNRGKDYTVSCLTSTHSLTSDVTTDLCMLVYDITKCTGSYCTAFVLLCTLVAIKRANEACKVVAHYVGAFYISAVLGIRYWLLHRTV